MLLATGEYGAAHWSICCFSTKGLQYLHVHNLHILIYHTKMNQAQGQMEMVKTKQN